MVGAVNSNGAVRSSPRPRPPDRQHWYPPTSRGHRVQRLHRPGMRRRVPSHRPPGPCTYLRDRGRPRLPQRRRPDPRNPRRRLQTEDHRCGTHPGDRALPASTLHPASPGRPVSGEPTHHREPSHRSRPATGTRRIHGRACRHAVLHDSLRPSIRRRPRTSTRPRASCWPSPSTSVPGNSHGALVTTPLDVTARAPGSPSCCPDPDRVADSPVPSAG
jgi:hypothetical protein